MNYDHLKNITDKYLAPKIGVNNLIKEDYKTSDIMDLVRVVLPKAIEQTKELSKHIPGRTKQEFLKNLYYLLKAHVSYKPDPLGSQWVKLPTAAWDDKVCDCKSYSTFIASVLENRGIPYKYRFVSYNSSKRPTHVYIIVPNGIGYISMDVVWKGYNQEKPFKNNIDMSYGNGLREVAGIEYMIDREPTIIDLGTTPIDEMGEGEMDLLLARANIEASKEIAESIKGIGNANPGYDSKIMLLNDALEATQAEARGELEGADDYSNIMDNIAAEGIAGTYDRLGYASDEIDEIGRRKRKRKRKRRLRGLFKKIKKKVKKVSKKIKKRMSKSKTGRFLLKIKEKQKRGLKAIARVVSAPQRLLIKKILEKRLPKASPHFLYLFIDDSEISKFPRKVQDKRKKQQKLAKFIIKGVGIKEKHFMSMVRTGIKKKFKKEPEKVIQDMARGKDVSGKARIKGVAMVDGIDKYYVGRSTMARNIQAKAILKDMSKLTKSRGPRLTIDEGPMISDFKSMRRGIRRGKTPMRLRRLPSRVQKVPMAKQAIPMIKKSAPYWLYLFINDANVLRSLPAIVRRKRAAQEKVADFLVINLNMTRPEFMAIVREGIKNTMGKQPEDILKAYVSKVAGIGAWGAIISAVVGLVTKVVGLFKKKKDKPKVSKSDTPDESDFGSLKESATKLIVDAIDDQSPVKQIYKKALAIIDPETDKIIDAETKKEVKDPAQYKVVDPVTNKVVDPVTRKPLTETYNGDADSREFIVRDDYEEDHKKGGTSLWDTL